MGPSGKWIDGIGPDSTVEEAARRSLANRLDVVDYWLPRAAYLAEQDVEHVHRLRVATRRAMAAVQLYRDWLPGKPSRWLKKRLKKIRRVAGDARDLDVLGERLAHDYGQRRAAPVVAEIGKRRAAVQPALIKATERCRRRDRFFRKKAKLVDGIRPPSDQVSQSVHFGDWAAEQLAKAAREFFAALPDESADMAALHQFRIRSKALRYTMELAAPAFGPELREEHYPVVEELQERLGKVQDHVTAAAHLREWSEGTKDSALREVYQELAAEENTRLEEELRDFREWWTANRAETLRRGLMPETNDAATATPRRQAAAQT
jgi:CHAD domain-containing protein